MIEKITPDEALKEQTQARMQQQAVNRKLKTRIIAGIASAAACLAIGIGVLSASGLFNPKGQILVPPDEPGITQSAAVGTNKPAVVLTGEPVKLSDLGLKLKSVEYPPMDSSATACLVAFSEDMIMDSCIIIKGTVENVRFNKYYDIHTTAVYEVRVDEVLYSEKDINPGDLLLLEQNLYMFTSLQDSVVGLKIGGQYLLPVYESESKLIENFDTDQSLLPAEAQEKGIGIVKATELESAYSIIYPYLPQIQVVPDVGFMFPSNWESLVTDDVTHVIVDVETENQGLYGELYMRSEGFMDDYMALIAKYVNPEYRAEHSVSYVSSLVLENGMLKTNEGIAGLHAHDAFAGIAMMDYSCEHDPATKEWVVSCTDDKGKTTKVRVPEYLPVPAEAEIIAAAKEYLPQNYTDLTPSVEFDELMECYKVNFADAQGKTIITAVVNILGRLNNYIIIE